MYNERAAAMGYAAALLYWEKMSFARLINHADREGVLHFGRLKASPQLVIKGLSPDYFALAMATGIVLCGKKVSGITVS